MLDMTRQVNTVFVMAPCVSEASHHGRVIREYREARVGMTQEELARRIGRSRRTIVTLEQSARVSDVKLRRTLALALNIPLHLLGLEDRAAAEATVLAPLVAPAASSKHLSRMVLETFAGNLRMRFAVYYTGSARRAGEGLRAHIVDLSRLLEKRTTADRRMLLVLLSQNYQLQGLIARDQVDDAAAEQCFKHASLLAQEAGCVELDALAMARRASVCLRRQQVEVAEQFCEAAEEIARRSAPVLRAYLALVSAEVQGRQRRGECLKSLTVAREQLRRVDPEDDPLLLLPSTWCTEQAIEDGQARCQVYLGKLADALEYYEELEQRLDPTLVRMRARMLLQYAWALYQGRDMSCCFSALEGLKLARAVGSRSNVDQAQGLAGELAGRFPRDERVKELLGELAGVVGCAGGTDKY